MTDYQNDKFYDILHDFNTAMLASHNASQMWHARPMQIVQIDEGGDIWFITGRDTGKVNEIQQDSQVLLTFQHGRDQFVSLSGRASLMRDQTKINELWQESFKVWFPQGKEDPAIVLIRVRPESGEYWDREGLNKAKYLFKAAKAYATGSRPDVNEPEEHRKVNF